MVSCRERFRGRQCRGGGCRAWSPRRWGPGAVPRGQQVQVGQDPVDDRLLVKDGDNLHGPAEARAQQRIYFRDLADQPRPGLADRQGRPVGVGNGRLWLRQGQSATGLMAPSSPIRPPAVVIGRLVMGIRDGRARLGEDCRSAETRRRLRHGNIRVDSYLGNCDVQSR